MTPDWRRIDHVQLCITPGSEALAREFYGDVLGFDEVEKPDSLADSGSIWFRAGDIELHLGIDEADAGTSTRHPAFEVGDLDTTRTYLEAYGVETLDETPIPGRERCTFRDPFGNRIELLELE
ncbi:VOC family protein [Halomarina salina]|uniref:VOC family protein n=1 Tax=Halomarina salina TaxID=1872699 RepID=A0ABD5RRR1_9EURY|nr:VOC family protein [Halomarina salina]